VVRPAAASLLLVSAWARKNVFLWTSLPPVIAIIMERIAFGTRYTLHLLQYRTWGIWDALGINVAPERVHGRVVSLSELFDNIAMGRLSEHRSVAGARCGCGVRLCGRQDSPLPRRHLKCSSRYGVASRASKLIWTGEWRALEHHADRCRIGGSRSCKRTPRVDRHQSLTALDLSGAWRLREFLQQARAAGAQVEFRGPPPDQLRLVDFNVERRVPGAPWCARRNTALHP